MKPPNVVWFFVLSFALTIAVVATLQAFLDHDWLVALAGAVTAGLAGGCIQHEKGKL